MRRIVGLTFVLALISGTTHAQQTQRESLAVWIDALESSKDPVRRFEAIHALTEAGPEARKAVPALIGTFRDEDATFLHPLAAVALSG